MQLLATLVGNRNTQTTTTSKLVADKSRYRGVQVNGHYASCCEAVRAVAGKRFLSDEVPTLPLNGCDALDCRCTYRLFDDRRTEIRRGSDVTFDIKCRLRGQDNRNGTSSGRRAHD